MASKMKSSEKIRHQLALLMGNGNKVTVVTKFGNQQEERKHGYIVGLNDDHLCLWSLAYWHHDGFEILPLKYIHSVESGEFEAVAHKILVTGGVVKNVKAPDWLDMTNFSSMLKSIMDNFNNVVVESNDPDEPELALGKIEEIEKKHFLLQPYDAAGKWMSQKFVIPFDEISYLGFGDEYSTVLRKYIDEVDQL